MKEKVFETKLKVKYIGKNKYYLHKQRGEGTLPDGSK